MKIADISVDLIHHVGDDLDVVNAARVSFDKDSTWVDEFGKPVPIADANVLMDTGGEVYLSGKDEKLINYLAAHKHHSPFNHCFMPWNEVSRRYVNSQPEFYYPEHWRAKADNVKQGSGDAIPDYYGMDVKSVMKGCLGQYNWMLQEGVCPEQARMVLPQNTMTEWRWSGTLGAFLDMLVLRLDKHTQAETRIVAEKIAQHVKYLFPVSYAAYIKE
jgi:thymidylate synthase (FAD)